MVFSELQLHLRNPSSSTSCAPMLQRGQGCRTFKELGSSNIKKNLDRGTHMKHTHLF